MQRLCRSLFFSALRYLAVVPHDLRAEWLSRPATALRRVGVQPLHRTFFLLFFRFFFI